jgi:hypothetical protein
MKTLRDYPIQELKVIYNILHAQFPRYTELMDSELLQDLQNDLHQRAEASGVDVGKTADWANWLGTCTK